MGFMGKSGIIWVVTGRKKKVCVGGGAYAIGGKFENCVAFSTPTTVYCLKLLLTITK